jgi:adenylosuccinate synthase
MLNGVTQVIMTKADVLDAFAELKVCSSYRIDGKETKEVPFQMSRVKIDPVLQSFPGWNMDTTSIKDAASLPPTMTNYINFINSEIGAPVKYVSNGPGRDQIVHV